MTDILTMITAQIYSVLVDTDLIRDGGIRRMSMMGLKSPWFMDNWVAFVPAQRGPTKTMKNTHKTHKCLDRFDSRVESFTTLFNLGSWRSGRLECNKPETTVTSRGEAMTRTMVTDTHYDRPDEIQWKKKSRPVKKSIDSLLGSFLK